MIFKVLADGKIWIQFILVESSIEEKLKYSTVLPKYGTYSYIEDDIIEFISKMPATSPSAAEARRFVESINKELNIAALIEA